MLFRSEIPDTIEDRQAVAARIRNLRAQTNLNEKRIAIGREYRAHRDRLRKSSRHDRDRGGWHAEFTKPSPFEDSRRSAEIHIQFYEAFGHLGSMLPRLPHGFRALQVLVTLKLSDAEIKSKCLSGEISPSTTEGGIWKLGAALGKVQAKPATQKSKKSMPPVRPTQEEGAKYIHGLSVDELLNACSSAQREEMWRRAKRQLKLIGVEAPEAEVLTLPAPAKSSPPSNDLVSAWDAAATQERARLARERGEQVVDAR